MNPLEVLLAQTFQCGEAVSGTQLPSVSFREMGWGGKQKDLEWIGICFLQNQERCSFPGMDADDVDHHTVTFLFIRAILVLERNSNDLTWEHTMLTTCISTSL